MSHMALKSLVADLCDGLPICSVHNDGDIALFGIEISNWAPFIALAAFLVTLFFNWLTRRSSLRVERSNAYFNLEMASSTIFKYEAEHADKIDMFRKVETPENPKEIIDKSTENRLHAYNLYFQTLNLFEVYARFRRQKIINSDIFASWIAWFYDTLDDWYFRDQWPDLRQNYTRDVRDIFDRGIKIFNEIGSRDDKTLDVRRRIAFYEGVAKIMKCKEIIKWKNELYLEKEQEQEQERFARMKRWARHIGLKQPQSLPNQPISSPEPSEAIPAT